MSTERRAEQMQQVVQVFEDAHSAAVDKVTKAMEAAGDVQAKLPADRPPETSVDEHIRAVQNAMDASEQALAGTGDAWGLLLARKKLISDMLDLTTDIQDEALEDENLMRIVVQRRAEAGHDVATVLYEGLVTIDPWWAESPTQT